MRILIVDDESIVLNSCERVLEEEGFDVSLATSVDQALEALTNENFYLLLIDIKMPRHDGMYLIREVKEKWPRIPIIVMSGYATTETVEEVSAMDAATFIAKPFTPDELLNAICQVIEREGCHESKEGSSD